MTAAMQRGTLRVENMYCHAEMTWAGKLIIQYTLMYLILVTLERCCVLTRMPKIICLFEGMPSWRLAI